jgi:tetratricopeptide (TPR) repeat protein
MSTRAILDSWKAISAYVGRTARTCHRWEGELGLPVHRLDGSPKSRVFAYKDEIDRWLEKKLHEGDKKFWGRVLPRPKRWVVALALTAFVVLVVLGWRTLNVAPLRPVFNGRPAVAVLPFVNGTGDAGLDFLGDSLPAHLIEGLQRSADHLTVYTPEVVADSLNKLGVTGGRELGDEDLKAVAARTGASFLVVGRIEASGGRLRVAYQLKDAATLETLGSDRESGTERTLPAVEDQLRASLLSVFGIPRGPAREVTLPCSPQANRFYEMARVAERRYVLSLAPADLEMMTGLFRQALAADPSCALAFHGLGDAFQFHYVYGGHDPQMLKAAFDNYRKAHDMEPERAETNLGLGWIHYFEQENEKAYAYFKRAMELDPANVRVMTDVAAFLNSVGIQERSVEYYSRSIRAGDTSAGTYVLRAAAYEEMGLYEGALADYDRVIKMEPNDGATRCRRARVLILMKRFTEAEDEIETAKALNPPENYVQIVRALLHAARGEKKAALAAIEPFRARPARYHNYLSRVYAALGMRNEAIDAIEKGIAGSFAEIQEYAFFFPYLNNTRDFFYDRLRGDKRFVEILKREERKYLAHLEKFVGL